MTVISCSAQGRGCWLDRLVSWSGLRANDACGGHRGTAELVSCPGGGAHEQPGTPPANTKHRPKSALNSLNTAPRSLRKHRSTLVKTMEAVKNTINTAVDKVAAAAGSVAGTAVPQGDNPSSQDLGVDKSTVSPIHERRNSLEKQLQNRPDVQDLKNRHILLDTNAAPFVPRLPLP